MSNPTIRRQDPTQEIDFRRGNQTNDSKQSDPLGHASLSVLSHVLENDRDGSRPIIDYMEELINEHEQQHNQSTGTMVSMNQLEAYLEELAKKLKDASDEAAEKMMEKGNQAVDTLVSTTNALGSSSEELEATNYDEATDETSEESSTPASSGSMQAVFDLQAAICSLDTDAVESNMAQSKDQIEINNAFQRTANSQYQALQAKLDKLEKEKHHHSFWGFLKGLGSLMKDIAKMEKDLVSGNVKGVVSDAHAIKNNAAVGDIKDAAKLFASVEKLIGEACIGDVKDVKKSWAEIEKNPSLGLVLQICAYAAAAAAIVATGLTECVALPT